MLLNPAPGLTPAARRWGLRLSWLCAASVTLLALSDLLQAAHLQSRLDRAQAVERAAEAILPALAPSPSQSSSATAVQAVLTRLLERGDLGLRYLAVTGADGAPLGAAGIYEGLRLPLVSDTYTGALRRFLYGLGGEQGALTLRFADGRTAGHIAYSVSDRVAAEVREAAVRRLRLSGFAALLLAAPLLALLTMVMRRTGEHHLAIWTERLASRREPALGAAPALAEDAPGSLPLRTPAAGEWLDQVGNALITVDSDARVRRMNAEAQRLTGWSGDEARGRLVYSVFHPLSDADEPLMTPAEQCLRENRPQPAQSCRLRSRNGELRPIEVAAAPLLDAEGRPDGAAMLFADVSARTSAIEALRKSERLAQGVIDHLVEGVVTTDVAGVIQFANARALRMFGYARDDLTGATVSKLMPVPFLNSPGVRLTDYVAPKPGARLPKVVGWRKDATTFPVELVVEPMRIGDGGSGEPGLVAIVRDITDRLKSDNLTLRLGRLLDSAAEEVYIFDAQSLYFVDVNRGARRNLGYPAEQLARMTPLTISRGLDAEQFQGYLNRLRGGEQEHLSYRAVYQRADGTTYPVEVRLNFSREEEPPVFMAIAEDITDRFDAENRLQQLTHFDTLTGLPNRPVLYERLGRAIVDTQRSRHPLAVMFVDVDRFKALNDDYGHETGDAVLKIVASRLREALRPGDTVARLSGDEFVIVAPALRAAADAEHLARKLVDAFRQPIEAGKQVLPVSVSVGVTVYPNDNSDTEGLVRHADEAMYQVKKSGRAAFRMFYPQLGVEARRRIHLERDVRTAVAMDQIRVRYQPVIAAATGRPAAARTLCRWQHPHFGAVGGNETRELAQSSGVLDELALWLIRSGCRLIQSAVKAGLPLLPFTVGAASWQLCDPEFCQHVHDLLDRYAVPGRLLVLGLTEEALAEFRAGAPASLARLREEGGVRLAAIGFGSGPPALDLLGPVPLDFVLLSGACAARLPDDADAAQLVRTVVGAAATLSLTVIATDVTRAEQRTALERLGCRYIAGPLLAEALTPAEFAEWVKGREAEPL